MCTYATVQTTLEGSAKGPQSSWFHVTDGTIYFDHPVHAMAEHTLNIDFANPAKGPSARVAVELTAAYLDHNVASILERHGINFATLQQKQDLAALIHLCGAGAGDAYAGRGLKLLADQRCGDHEVRGYIARVNMMKRVFALLAAGRERM